MRVQVVVTLKVIEDGMHAHEEFVARTFTCEGTEAHMQLTYGAMEDVAWKHPFTSITTKSFIGLQSPNPSKI